MMEMVTGADIAIFAVGLAAGLLLSWSVKR